MRESTATYEVARIQFVPRDVAVGNVHQRPVTLDGQPLLEDPEGRPLYVLVKDGPEWIIAAAQNTRVNKV